MSSINTRVSAIWDKLGLSLSVLCAIHCLFVPVFLALIPLSPVVHTIEHWLHPIFVLLIAPTVFYAARRSHYSKKIVTLLTAGFILIILGWIIGDYWLGELFESTATLSGSIFLITGHWFNYRHHQTCSNSSHTHHPLEESLLKEKKHETT